MRRGNEVHRRAGNPVPAGPAFIAVSAGMSLTLHRVCPWKPARLRVGRMSPSISPNFWAIVGSFGKVFGTMETWN
jgi:hypothetical protein